MKRILLIILLALSCQLNAQDADKTVSIVVSGSGKTQDEAKQNALRSAIEQAFGTFISSETVINNDSFVSDNITSLSQGSVISFNLLSSNILPDSNVAITLSATVSISQMQKITESKGYVTTIAGGVFGMNLKLLKLQAAAEEKVILDMARKSLIILDNSIDFKLDVVPPLKSDIRVDLQRMLSEGSYSQYWKNTNELLSEEIYKIRFTVECRPNSNLDVFIDYFINTVEAVKMSESEVEFAKQSGSKYFELVTLNGSVYLRNFESIRIMYSLFERTTLSLLNYDIVSNEDIINYTPFYNKNLVEDVNKHYQHLKANYFYQGNLQIHYVFIHGLLTKRKISNQYYLDINYPSDLSELERNGRYLVNLYRTDYDGGSINGSIYFETLFSGRMQIPYKTIPSKNNMNVRYQVFDYYLPLSEVEKLDTIKILKHAHNPNK